MTEEYEGQKFLTRRNGAHMATPLLLVLVLVEFTDIVFAVDSIPAIFAVTQETFLVFTANAFAILGLRAMYFLLADRMHRFVYLRLGLGLVLVWFGVKLVLQVDSSFPARATTPPRTHPSTRGRTSMADPASARTWTLLTNHGHVLVHVSRNPDSRIRDIAAAVGITERATLNIVRDLEDEGYLTRVPQGRRTHYVVNAHRPFRHPAEADHQVGDLLALFA